MAQKRVFVTGGAGFIGSALCRYLVQDQQVHVINIDKLTYAAAEGSLRVIEESPLYDFHQLDITDQKAIDALYQRYQPDGILHLAAESHVDRSIDGAADFIQTNIVGTFALLEATRHYLAQCDAEKKQSFRFLHVSTDEVYGSLSPALGAADLFTEETSYDPSSPYSASKASADHLVQAWGRTYGMPVLLTNCSNNYGPYHFPEKLIPLVILNALDHQELPIYGEGTQVRDWLYVEDHVKGLWCVFENGTIGEKYNIGGSNERRNIDVVQSICRYLDQRCPERKPEGGFASLITHVQDRPAHDLRYAIDANKIMSELGWRAEENFDSGIAKTIDWYLENRWWWQPIREKTYAGTRMGAGK